MCFARDKEKSGWPCGTPDCGGNKRSERAGRDFPLFWRQVGAQMRCGACVFFCMSPFSLCVAALAKKKNGWSAAGRLSGRVPSDASRRPQAQATTMSHTHPIPWSLFLEFLLLLFPLSLLTRKARPTSGARRKRRAKKMAAQKSHARDTAPRPPCLSSGPTRRVIRASNQWGIFIRVVQPERNA